MGKWLKNNNGLTLIEVLVSLAILGIIAAPLSSMFLTTIKSNQRAKDILLASHFAQQYMEKLKASPNPMNEVIPPVDPNNGFVLKTEITEFKNEDFKLPSDGGSVSFEYESIVDLINIDGKDVFVYDGEGNYEGKIGIKDNGMNNLNLIIINNQLIFQSKNKKGGEVIIDIDTTIIDIKIMYEGDLKVHIFVDNIYDRTINIYTNTDVIKHFDIKGDSNNVTVLEYLEENPVETANILYKITVIVMDKTGTEQLAKLVGLKKAQ